MFKLTFTKDFVVISIGIVEFDLILCLAQSAGALEYTDCFSAEG